MERVRGCPDPAAHKRLILMATTINVGAAYAGGGADHVPSPLATIMWEW
jgi:hypothetical protein